MRDGGPNRGLLGVLLLLAVVVLVPTAGVVWFMTAAMRNERAAVRQSLTAAHEVRLAGRVQQLEALWEARRARLDGVGPDEPGAEVFAALVRDDVADSVIVFDEEGAVRYPADPDIRPPARVAEPPAWLEAQRLEFGAGRYAAAARAYGRVARETRNVHLAARALQAQARCLGKAGEKDAAAAILVDDLTDDRYQDARDGQGRLIVPDSLLLALHLLDGEPMTGARAAEALRQRLGNYGEPAMPMAQRRFLMRQLESLRPEEAPIDTAAAEELAGRFLETEPAVRAGGGLSTTALPGVWQLASGSGEVVGLFQEATVLASLTAIEFGDEAAAVELEMLPPGGESSRSPFLTRSTGAILPGWRVALHLGNREVIDAAVDEGTLAYLWTGALLIVAALAAAVLIVRSIGRQMRLAKLKNDLIATVTHELKTPLASMRLLVDTLLDGERHDSKQVRDYLELIASENERLSRLIEDFLAFSRMERNKQAFDREPLDPAAVATSAAAAVSARFNGANCRFDVEIAEELPQIVGDPEALSTVLVNLLDNAYKYTAGEKEISLATYGENGSVVFSVSDNGVGLSRRQAKRIFDRFYQVDQSLSRSGSGVGLGLAIVKFIVDAHRGEVSVESEPGKGSTFQVRIPAIEAAPAGNEEAMR